nr:peptidase C48, SUMO/sentrin/Ubl1 [Tanacetum cinerariifolium]
MDEQDWSKVERTQDLIDYVYAKYGNTWKESDEATDEMLDDLYNFAMMKKSKKRKAKLMVSDEMGKGKVEDLQNRVSKLEVDLAWALKAKQAEHDKGKAKQAEHDLYDVDLDGLDLENIVKKLKEVFSRMLKAKEAKEAGEAELKVNEEVVQVSSDKGFSGDEDVVCFNDVKYSLTDTEIRMFKERPITSKSPPRQLASTSTRSRAHTAFTSTRSRASTASTSTFKASTRSRFHIASTSNAQAAFTSASRVYRRIAMT